MAKHFEIDDSFIAEQNQRKKQWLDEDYEHLATRLRRRGVDIESLTSVHQSFQVAIPSWGVGTGGTRFARFPGPGEPREVFEKPRRLRDRPEARSFDSSSLAFIFPPGTSLRTPLRFASSRANEACLLPR